MRILLIIIILLGILVFNFIDSNPDDDRILDKLKFDSTRVDINTYKCGDKKVRYVDIGKITNRMIIFIHGAPGTLEAFNLFLKDPELRSKVRMISVDRPGYGHSDFGTPETSLKRQSELIAPLLHENLHSGKPIIVGHSFGGTIAAKMAMDFPEMVGTIILVGAAVDPDHEKFFSIARLVEIPLINKLVPVSMRVAYAEKNTHVIELKKILPDWPKIQCNVIVLHGKEDGLVPVENAYFVKKESTNATTEIKIFDNTGHLIPWTKPDLIKNEILLLIK